MNKKRAIWAAAAVAVLSQTSSAALKIVTTTPDLSSIAAAVGGNNVSVSALVVGARDAHRIEAKPSYMSRVATADLFIANGLDLEVGYESAILRGSRNRNVQIGGPRHVYASDWTYVLEKPAGPVSRSMGDIHPEGNPHTWLDPWNGRTVAVKLADKLGDIDPKNDAEYKANAKTFVNRLDDAMFGSKLVDKYGGLKLWDWERDGTLVAKLRENNDLDDLRGWEAAMLPLRGKAIITYHRSFSYFAKRFDLRVVDELEPKPGLDPTPGHLAEVIKVGQASDVKLILQESFYNSRHAQLVASRIGARVVVVPQSVGHDAGAKDYISLFDIIVGRVAGALK
jgi:zinc/manganese transport system substrate-binding protein